MTQAERSPWTSRKPVLLVIAFLVGAGVMVAIGALLLNIQSRKGEAQSYPLNVVQLSAGELDPAVWGRNFPREYDSFLKTADYSYATEYGGARPDSRLERYPAMVRLWAGYAFSVDHNEERGHAYALEDQKKTRRVTEFKQPGACANCHSAEAPQLISEMGWAAFSRTPYNDLAAMLHTGTSCADCHDPDTMALRITRPAFINAMETRGVDLSRATRQEMRSYVCGQCHVEYYFQGDDKLLTFPWEKGLDIDSIEAYYDKIAFKDWVHKETGAPMLKMQHPEFEIWSSGIHARSGVACADCHMAYLRDGAIKISDHWLRSPLTNINNACQTCHTQGEEELKERVIAIQDTTAELLRKAEDAIVAAIDSIVAARNSGATDVELAPARDLHRRASMRWDFVSSENSTGFHSPQETASVLANSIDYARQAQLAAERLVRRQ